MSNEKEQLEIAACNKFLKAYGKIKGVPIKGESPDFTIIDTATQKLIGIEIAHAFDEGQAVVELGRKLFYPSDKQLDESNSYSGTTEGLIAQINQIIANKIQIVENYRETNKMLLVIRIGDSITDLEDIKNRKHTLLVPENIFDEIWLLIYDNSAGDWNRLFSLN